MRSLVLVIVLTLFTITGCKNEKRTDRTSQAPPTSPYSTEGHSAFESIPLEVQCFAEKTPAMNMDGAFNYHLIKLEKKPDRTVSGVELSFPYGTDSFRASVQGVIKEDDQSIAATLRGYAEGAHFQQQTNFRLFDDRLELGYQDPDGNMAALPMVPCTVFDSLLQEYQQGILQNLVNTTDRTQLKALKNLNSYGYSAEELDQAPFMERAVDLDRDPATQEYLIYLMDPARCGSGGCNLLVVDSEHKIVANITVTKLPIYTLIEDMEVTADRKGEWKDLFVYSKGMRRLSPRNGVYPANPSMEEEMRMEQLTAFPENYLLLMDYLEQE